MTCKLFRPLPKFSIVAAFSILFFQIRPAFAQQWQSAIVHYGSAGRLVYIADSAGNRIPDFSYAGYKNGEAPIPDVPVVKTIAPIEGDNTDHIQSAILEVSFMPPDANGIRGAVLLSAGVYEIRGTLKVRADGVVLRGVGDGADPATNTILWATGDTPHQRTVVSAGGGVGTRWKEMVAGTKVNIVSDTVFVGARTFEVADASPFAVGDNIIIYHPCTEAWLRAIDWGGTHSDLPAAEPGVDVPWSIGSQPIVFNRYITQIEGNAITIDAPVFNHLIRALSQSYVYTYARSGLRTQIGIENLRIDIETVPGASESHAWNGIDLFQVEDAWVRNSTVLHFGLSGIRTASATRVTVENCRALDPVSEIAGGRRYNFNVYTASQLILFKNCEATNGRHHYVSNGTSWTSGVVFLDCTSSGAFASSEGHRRWSMGLLFDNHKELDGPRPGYNPRLLGLYNRGHYGTSHGWAAAHSVAWNSDVAGGDLIVQKPPTAQNYAIGCFGNVTGVKPPASFDEPEGYIEGKNLPGLEPRSLYLAQLQERLGRTVAVRENGQKKDHRPGTFRLAQNYPNPFNAGTTVEFFAVRGGTLDIRVFDMRGREVAVLFSGRLGAGRHRLVWEARERPSGIYLLRAKFEQALYTRRIVLVK